MKKAPNEMARMRARHHEINALVASGKGRKAWAAFQSMPAKYRAVVSLLTYIGQCRIAIARGHLSYSSAQIEA